MINRPEVVDESLKQLRKGLRPRSDDTKAVVDDQSRTPTCQAKSAKLV